MFQGSKTLKSLNWEEFPFNPRDIDAVLLTHAHIDHSGLLPKLKVAGFRGAIHATPATADLCAVMLPDSGHVQEMEVAQLNRRNRRKGRAAVRPIYTVADAAAVIPAFRTTPLGRWVDALPDMRARWWNAGHMLGSASIEIECNLGTVAPLRILISGDLGPDCSVFHPESEAPGALDHVFLESTYGDEDKPCMDHVARREKLAAIVGQAAKTDGALLIPAFAVERTQEICWDLVMLMQAGAIPQVPIFLDSPLAIRATDVFLEHASLLENGEAVSRALRSPLIRPTESGEASRRIADTEGFHIIIAGSGMCDAGRIRHHLKRWLWNPAATVLLTGYQAEGTLGRLLLQGKQEVRIQGETIRVEADIKEIRDFSGHADAAELARWLAARGQVSGGVFLMHGEAPAMEALAKRLIASRVAATDQVIMPVLDERWALHKGARPKRLEGKGRRADPLRSVMPDWHNQRAALMLAIESATENARDDDAREDLLQRLRAVLEGV